MPGPHHRRREYAGPGAVAKTMLNPAWSHLEPPSPASKRSGLTSSDDAPRYRRGSKRRPKPPNASPGLVRPLHDSVALAHFPGKGLGYAAVREIPATTLLFQERPLEIAGAFADAEQARRALARAMASDARFARLSVGAPPRETGDVSSLANGDGDGVARRTRGSRRVPTSSPFEPSPFRDEGIDDDAWNDALRRARAHARVRRANASRVDDASTSKTDAVETDDVGGEGGHAETPASASYVARVFAHVSVCNHSCLPNAAASVGDAVVTVYSLRAIAPGEEICVSYASALLWLPAHARRAQLARHWGFLCRCERCDAELARAAAERDRGAGGRVQASRFGARRAGGVDSREAREAEQDAGFRAWEYGETGFESQFDDEGRLRSADRDRHGDDRASSENVGTRSEPDGAVARVSPRARDGFSSSDSDTSDSSLSDSSSDSDSSSAGLGSTGAADLGPNGSWRKGGGKKRRGGRERGGAVVSAARLYDKLSRAGIGPDHWQMHATREALVSRLLSAEGRKDFDLDLLLEHANCAARLAPNHPHFVRLVTLVEEVFKSNRDVIVAEQFWVWTIELLREAVHPDVLFWNTAFKGMPGDRAVGGEASLAR